MNEAAEFVAEKRGINLYAEHTLHAALKAYLAEPGDRMEVAVEGRVVDLLRADGELVEVQTRSLGALLPKLRAYLAAGHRVRLVHPLALGSTLVRLDPESGVELSRRRSPRRRDLWHLFDELVRASALVALEGLSLEVLFVRTVETKVRDGSGSWRKKGLRTLDRAIESVEGSRVFTSPADWLALIPAELEAPWSSATLGQALGIPGPRARKVLYTLWRAGLLAEAGKAGRCKLYVLSQASSSDKPATKSARPKPSRKRAASAAS